MQNSILNLSSILGRQVLIGVGGGIAAYKICELVSALAKAGAEVRVILTGSAQQFITPLTFATLSRHPAFTDQDFWQPTHGRPLHIQLGEWAEVLVIAPLTAQTLGKLAHGLADNLLTNTVLASTCPVLLAPAMNRKMWQQIAVQRNWQQVLTDPRFHGIAPRVGMLACDVPNQLPDQDLNSWQQVAGRMAEPEQIRAQVESLLHTQGQRDLTNYHLLLSAGGTREYFDPVRFIGNPSTGKMGIALATAAVHRGARVTFVHGPIHPELMATLPPVAAVAITSAAEMHQTMLQHFAQANIIIMAAAVADVRPQDCHTEKLPKRSLPSSLALEPIPDIVAELGKLKQPHQKLIGFAAQTGNILAPALRKLEEKQLDAIVANPIDQPQAGFGSETNQAIFLDRQGRNWEINRCSKLQLAHHLFDFLSSLS
ncbi:MAG: bifunctional phosphopantothenoylcysteine decarboxylase/phosphopantothenate--cysteine ligase CoaBC [Oscillatoriales cyanobacterium SM2_3_0]|nr:bifunctional phosphopantothenoylcysteine decarboxylase/phosphopantothenate--cysteine ligase CoaBC [Oscillatoriales cyanobacterium SM2_3_0]